jgi:hypothetical protein
LKEIGRTPRHFLNVDQRDLFDLSLAFKYQPKQREFDCCALILGNVEAVNVV